MMTVDSGLIFGPPCRRWQESTYHCC